MERKFFKKVSPKDMAALDWRDIRAPTWTRMEYRIPTGRVIRGGFFKKRREETVTIDLTDRAIWFYGTKTEINQDLAPYRLTLVFGGNDLHPKLSILAKRFRARNEVMIQIRAQMPTDADSPADIGVVKGVQDNTSLSTLAISINRALTMSRVTTL